MLAGTVNVGFVLSPTVKLAFEISKKTLPTASTFILAVVLYVQGIFTDSDPSFAVLASNVTGKVFPPSIDNRMFTFVASVFELFTLQVTV